MNYIDKLDKLNQFLDRIQFLSNKGKFNPDKLEIMTNVHLYFYRMSWKFDQMNQKNDSLRF